MRQVAGGDHVRHGRAEAGRGPPALRQVDLDEVAVLALEAAERVQGLHHSRPLGPAAAGPGRQRQHGHLAAGQGGLAEREGRGGEGRGGEVPPVQSTTSPGNTSSIVLDRGKPVLRQTDAAGAEVGPDLFVQLRVETVLLEEPAEADRAVAILGRRGKQRGKQHLGGKWLRFRDFGISGFWGRVRLAFGHSISLSVSLFLRHFSLSPPGPFPAAGGGEPVDLARGRPD